MKNDERSVSFVAGWAGFLAVAILLSTGLGAILVSGWKYGINTYSDLGVMGSTASMFNYGLVIGGVLLVAYGQGRGPKESGSHRIAACLVGFAGTFLMLAGAYTVDIEDGDIHFALLDIFFVLFLAALAIEGYAGRKDGMRGLIIGGINIITVVIAIVGQFAMPHAKYEILAAVCALIQMAANSYGYMLSEFSFKKMVSA